MLRSPRGLAHSTGQIAARALQGAAAVVSGRGARLRRSAGRDEAVRVAPHGFGQHENPICARPRRLSPAITASNFVVGASLDVPPDFHRSSPRFTTPASFSSLAVDVAIDVFASYMRPRRSCKRPKPRITACPQETCVVHGVPQQFTQFTAYGWRTQARTARKAPRNATKPRKFPYAASISTRIDLRVSSPTFIGQDGVELRIGVSFKCRSTCASRHRFCAGELLVSRPSSLPST